MTSGWLSLMLQLKETGNGRMDHVSLDQWMPLFVGTAVVLDQNSVTRNQYCLEHFYGFSQLCGISRLLQLEELYPKKAWDVSGETLMFTENNKHNLCLIDLQVCKKGSNPCFSLWGLVLLWTAYPKLCLNICLHVFSNLYQLDPWAAWCCCKAWWLCHECWVAVDTNGMTYPAGTGGDLSVKRTELTGTRPQKKDSILRINQTFLLFSLRDK